MAELYTKTKMVFRGRVVWEGWLAQVPPVGDYVELAGFIHEKDFPFVVVECRWKMAPAPTCRISVTPERDLFIDAELLDQFPLEE